MNDVALATRSKSARPRARLKGVKVLSRGLKNFVLSDDNSMDEAMAAARSDTDRELTAHQLDAFHKTFNFCMSCRQYTCPNCWNEAEARCLTCAPHLGHEVLPAPFPDLVTSSYLVADPVEEVAANGSNGSNSAVHEMVGEEAPATGVDTSDFAARLAALMAPPPLDEPTAGAAVAEPAEAVAEIAPDVIADVAVEAAAELDEPAEAEPVAQVEDASDIPYVVEAAVVEAAEPVAAEPEPVAAEEPDGDAEIAARLAAWSAAAVVMDAARDEESGNTKGAAQTGGLLRRFRAGQNLDAELDDYERQQDAAPPVADELEPEIVVAAEAIAEPEVVVAAEAIDEPVAAEAFDEPAVVAEPEVVAAEVAAAAMMAAEPEVVAEPEVAAAAEPEVVAEPEVASAAEPEVVAEPEVASAAAPETPAEPVRPVEDVIPQPTWQTFAPDTTEMPGTPPPGSAPSIPAAASAADPNAEPQWPDQPQWPGVASPAAGLPFLNRPPTPTGGVEALWAASAREVVAPPTVAGRPVAGAVQPCLSCGLSLSATARFCRRCGTPQAV